MSEDHRPWKASLLLEEDVRAAARVLGELERERDTEYIRLIAAGDNTYLASRKADLEYGPRITLARAELEIMLARLRR